MPKNTFVKILLEKIHPIILPLAKSTECEKRIGNVLMGIDSPEPPLIKLTKYEEYLVDVFYDYSEIDSSIDCLQMIEYFLKASPYSLNFFRKVDKVKYLQYHVGTYFNELYILKTRLEKFLNKLKKKCKKNKLTDELIKIDKMKNIYAKIFRSWNLIRGDHVHNTRYDDIGFEQLRLLELVTKKGNLKQLQPIEKNIYSNVKKKWLKKIKKNNRNVKYVLDKYLEILKIVVFQKLANSIIKNQTGQKTILLQPTRIWRYKTPHLR